MECFRLLFDHIAWIEHQFLSGIRNSRKARSLWGMMKGVGGVRKSEHLSWFAKGLGLGLLCWGFKRVQKEIPLEWASTLQNRVSGISTRTMHQSTTPSLSQTIWARWASRQFLSLPIVQTLLPVTFAYSLSSRKNLETVVMRQLRRWKKLWWRSLTHSHKRTSKGPSRSCLNSTISALQLEEITSKEFHVCTINKSAHTKKSGNLYNDPRIFIIQGENSTGWSFQFECSKSAAIDV